MQLFYRAKAFFKKPYNIILCMLLVALTFLTLLPLLSIVKDTFVVHTGEVAQIGQPANTYTLNHWYKVFASGISYKTLYEPLMHSLTTSLGACFIAITVGGLFAWLITRTNLRWKNLLSSLCIFPYIMPAWTLALAWRNIFKNSVIGGAPGIFTALTGLETPNWLAYGALPIALVTGIHYAPFAYMLIGSILRNMDANLEEAALILKSSRAQIIRKITIPMVTPAILSTFLLVFSSAMSSFAVPTFLGLPVRYYVLSTQLYRTLNGVNKGQGYVIALFLISLGVTILMINQLIEGRRKSFTTVTGKSANIALVNLKSARTLISVLTAVAIICVSILPLISFALESLLLIPGDYSASNITFQFWIGTAEQNTIANSEPGLLLNPMTYKVLLNSLKLSLVASLGAGTIGFLAGYAIVRGRKAGKLATVINNLTFFPYLMPSLAFSAIYLSMFGIRHGPIPSLYGTFALLALIGIVKYLPFASRAGINSMHQLSGEIEEAGLILGANWFDRMRKLIIPIQKSSFISGYLLPFTSCMRELSLFVLLVTPNTRVLTTLLYYYNEKGWSQYANAVNLMIVLLVVGFNLLVNKVTGASIDKGIGG